MKTVKRITAAIALTAFVICMAGTIKAKAEVIEDAYNVLDLIPGLDLTSITEAYDNLSIEQQLIVQYIMGAYNNVYLCARGFQYNIPDDETSIKAEFQAIGKRVLEFAINSNLWRSRVNEVFRQYLSSAIVYSSNYSTFDAFYSETRYGGNNVLYIPYTEDAFSAWTTFYNDASGDGIASFGAIVSAWDSGIFYDYAFTSYAWADSSSQNQYNNFILNHNPVIFTNDFASGPYRSQAVLAISTDIPDSIFILRGSNDSAQYFRYGYSNITVMPANIMYAMDLTYRPDRNYVYVSGNGSTNNPMSGIINTGSVRSYPDFIDYVFHQYNPIVANSNGFFNYFYPYISHVYLVDNLNTLSNVEEIENVDSLNVVAPVDPHYIVAPNDRMILPLWPFADDDPMNLWDNIVDNSIKEDGSSATDDDFHKSIVNNTTINNYYVSGGEPINVPSDWFDNDYTIQLFEDSQDLFDFASDCIDCIGDLRIIMFGAIVVGLAGGMVNKLLL